MRGVLLLSALLLSTGCAPLGRSVARLRSGCPRPQPRSATFESRPEQTPAAFAGRYAVTWVRDGGEGRGRVARTVLWLAPDPRAPQQFLYGAVADSAKATPALARLGLRPHWSPASRTLDRPGFVTEVRPQGVLHFLIGSHLNATDAPLAMLRVDEHTGPGQFRGSWSSAGYFGSQHAWGHACVERLDGDTRGLTLR